MAHTFIKEVNGHKIMHWSLGEVYYISKGLAWVTEDKDLKVVEEFAKAQ